MGTYIQWDTILPLKGMIMPFEAAWMDLVILKLSEVSQKKAKYRLISLICEM